MVILVAAGGRDGSSAVQSVLQPAGHHVDTSGRIVYDPVRPDCFLRMQAMVRKADQ